MDVYILKDENILFRDFAFDIESDYVEIQLAITNIYSLLDVLHVWTKDHAQISDMFHTPLATISNAADNIEAKFDITLKKARGEA